MSRSNIHFLFRPQSIAVVGASTREGTVGHALFSNVLMNHYTGVVFPVNMKAKSVMGVKAYPSILHIPDEVDLAVLVVPALTVPAALSECGQKGVKAAIVISAGFKELGPVGAKLEKSVRQRAREHCIAMVGPNCFGLINTDSTVRLNTTFGRVMPQHGNIAFVSQSGAVGVNALEYAESEGVGLSKFASIGNKADVNENDLLEYLKEDDETDVIAMYLEDLVDPAEFMRIARTITSDPGRPKPILAIKSGRTSEGRRRPLHTPARWQGRTRPTTPSSPSHACCASRPSTSSSPRRRRWPTSPRRKARASPSSPMPAASASWPPTRAYRTGSGSPRWARTPWRN